MSDKDNHSPAEAHKALQVPTSDPWTNLAIQMLSCEDLGNQVFIQIGFMVVELGKFNMWVAIEGKNNLSGEELLRLCTKHEQLLKDAYEMWVSFLDSKEKEDDFMSTLAIFVDRFTDVNDQLRSLSAMP